MSSLVPEINTLLMSKFFRVMVAPNSLALVSKTIYACLASIINTINPTHPLKTVAQDKNIFT